MKKRWMGLVVCLAFGQVQAASFDCGKAGTKVEKLICANEGLSKLDEQMTEAYRAALKQAAAPETLKKRQLQWLKDLRRYCKTAKCVEGTYWARTRALEDGEGARVYDTPDLKARKEADKAAKVKALLTQYPMRLHVGPRTEKHREFCNRLYEALRTASPEIQYIEPVFRTDDPTHPALGEYLDCHLYGGPRGLKTFQLYSRGSRGFRLYQLDIDGNPKNGLEEYIYGQEPVGVGQENGSAGYERVDLNECWSIDGASAHPENPIVISFKSESGVNALVRYQGKHIAYDWGEKIYDFEREKSLALRNMYTWSYAPAKQGFDLACMFGQPHRTLRRGRRISGIHSPDESGSEVRQTVPERQAVGQIREEEQDAADGTDATGTDLHPAGRRGEKCEPQPERLGELLPLPELQRQDEPGQTPRGRAAAHPLAETPQNQEPEDGSGQVPAPRPVRALWAIQTANEIRLELGACLGMKNIGKPCAGKPHARFDEGGQARACSLLYPLIL